jgi:NADH-quinone oxidoreductase subunit N
VAFLATAPKVATTAALARLLTDALGGMSERWIPLLAVAGGVSMLVGTIVALAQDSVRRLLAWSGIGHVGLLLVALAANTPEAIGTLLFYGAAYALAAPGAFLLVEAVGDRLPDWRGLGRRQPFAALAMLLFLLSMGGIPFVAGFWAKMFVLWAAWQAGLEPLVFLAVLLAVAGLFYYLKVARSMYVEAPDGTAPASPARAATWVAVVLALAGVVGLGVWPGPTLEAALEAGDGLFSGVVAERR